MLGDAIGSKKETCIYMYIYEGGDRKNEDRIVNGYELDFGQPWYAGLGFSRDPRFFFLNFFLLQINLRSDRNHNVEGRGNCKKWQQ